MGHGDRLGRIFILIRQIKLLFSNDDAQAATAGGRRRMRDMGGRPPPAPREGPVPRGPGHCLASRPEPSVFEVGSVDGSGPASPRAGADGGARRDGSVVARTATVRAANEGFQRGSLGLPLGEEIPCAAFRKPHLAA